MPKTGDPTCRRSRAAPTRRPSRSRRERASATGIPAFRRGEKVKMPMRLAVALHVALGAGRVRPVRQPHPERLPDRRPPVRAGRCRSRSAARRPAGRSTPRRRRLRRRCRGCRCRTARRVRAGVEHLPVVAFVFAGSLGTAVLLQLRRADGQERGELFAELGDLARPGNCDGGVQVAGGGGGVDRGCVAGRSGRSRDAAPSPWPAAPRTGRAPRSGPAGAPPGQRPPARPNGRRRRRRASRCRRQPPARTGGAERAGCAAVRTHDRLG